MKHPKLIQIGVFKVCKMKEIQKIYLNSFLSIVCFTLLHSPMCPCRPLKLERKRLDTKQHTSKIITFSS